MNSRDFVISLCGFHKVNSTMPRTMPRARTEFHACGDLFFSDVGCVVFTFLMLPHMPNTLPVSKRMRDLTRSRLKELLTVANLTLTLKNRDRPDTHVLHAVLRGSTLYEKMAIQVLWNSFFGTMV